MPRKADGTRFVLLVGITPAEGQYHLRLKYRRDSTAPDPANPMLSRVGDDSDQVVVLWCPKLRVRHDKGFERAMTAVMQNDVQLFKHLSDEELFWRELTDTVFGLTCETAGCGKRCQRARIFSGTLAGAL